MTKQILIISIILIFIIVGFYLDKWKQNTLLEHTKITSGKVRYAGSGIKSVTLSVRYNFTVDGIEITGQNGYGINILNKDCLKDRIFAVVYDYTNPRNSQILITRDDFSKFKIPFPDSFPCVFQF